MNGQSNEGKTVRMEFNIADISRPIASIGEIIGKENRAVFDSEESYIENKRTGSWIPMRRDGYLFFIDMWCQIPANLLTNPFVRQVGSQ